MTLPLWVRVLLRSVTPRDRVDDVLGDMEEMHRARVRRRGRLLAWLLTSLEAVDVAVTLLGVRLRAGAPAPRRASGANEGGVLWRPGVSWLDFKLGLRMLVRFPGLSVVATLAIGFVVTIGAGTYDFFEKFTDPVMPFEDGDRIVELSNRDLRTGGHEQRMLHDFVLWRDELTTVEDVGAWHAFQRNLITDRGSVPRIGAAVTANLLSIPRVPPMLGRLLTEADETPGAPGVVVLGYDTWRTQFGADPDVVGSPVHLGSSPATVVGVMPDGFEWPHGYQLWTPMQLNPLDFERGESPAVSVAARLSPGVGREEAEAELAAVGLRTATDHPDTNGHLRPEISDFGAQELPVVGITHFLLYSTGALAFAALMLLASGNVALLLFARTAARESELAVRSALGASRGRIVGQLFVEAMLLGGLAAALGLTGARLGIAWVVRTMEGMGEGALGFWFHQPLQTETAVGATLITLLAAALAGAVPALKVTGRKVGSHLKRAGSGAGLEFSRLWTVIIVSQIAVTVAFMPLVIYVGHEAAESRTPVYGFPAEEYLAVDLATGGGGVTIVEGLPRDPRLLDADLGAAARELERRLEGEPEVRAVTLAGQVPGAYHGLRSVEIEGPAAVSRTSAGHRVRWTAVDAGFFAALGAPIVAGRGFDPTDMASGEHVAIVNGDFVRDYLEDRNAVGRRFRFRDPSWREGEPMRMGPWYEIVGVVGQIAMTLDPELESVPGYYVPLPPSGVDPLRMVIHVGRDPETFASRLRALTAEIDQDMLLADVRPLDDSAYQARVVYTSWFWVVLGAGGIGLLLATVGIYSIMAFTVSRRTREIGVRVALGAGRRAVLWSVFARALRQVAMGVAGGALIIAVFGAWMIKEESIAPAATHAVMFVLYLFVMSVVCGLACVVPTARALAVEPTAALKAEA